MDISGIATVISTVGFPIGMCLILCLYVKQTNESYREDIKTLQKSIDNNTAVMQRLIDKFDE